MKIPETQTIKGLYNELSPKSTILLNIVQKFMFLQLISDIN